MWWVKATPLLRGEQAPLREQGKNKSIPFLLFLLFLCLSHPFIFWKVGDDGRMGDQPCHRDASWRERPTAGYETFQKRPPLPRLSMKPTMGTHLLSYKCPS